MTARDISAITETLERALQNFSLNSRNDDLGNGSDEGMGISSTSDDNIASADDHVPFSDTTVELNSHLSLPYHWEQCLDLKTGEIYYINWKNGMKVKEDPRRMTNAEHSGESCLYSEEDSSYDSEESSSESSPSSSRQTTAKQQDVLVVAGCKACFMYFMVPKLLQHCPKCSGHLLHFDRPENGSP